MFLLRLGTRFGPEVYAYGSSTNPIYRGDTFKEFTWKRIATDLRTANSRLSPTSILNILRVFSEEYKSRDSDWGHRKAMINDTDFIKLLAAGMRDLHLFTASDLVQLVHLTSVQIDWRDSSLLRSVEPRILEEISSLSAEQLVTCLDSFAKLRCGSRQFWETLIAAITVSDVSERDVIRMFRMMANNPKTFYKPSIVVKSLFPHIARIGNTIDNSDVSKIIHVCNDKQKVIGANSYLDLLSCLLPKFDWDTCDLVDLARIGSSIGDYESIHIHSFFNSLELHVASLPPLEKSSTKSRALSQILSVLFKRGSRNGNVFAALEGVLVNQLPNIDMKSLSSCCLTLSRVFHITNSPCEITSSFGPETARSADFLANSQPLLLERMPFTSGRCLSKLMLGFGTCRRGSRELWASMVTVLGQHLRDPEAFSPDELEGVMFGLAEMNLALSDDLKNSLVVASLERIHLMQKSFDIFLFYISTCFDGDERANLAARVLELMDLDQVLSSKRPAIVLLNLALRQLAGDIEDPTLVEIISETSQDLDLFFRASRSLIHPTVLNRFATTLGPGWNRDMEIDSAGLWVDFMDDESRTVILISSPQMMTSEEYGVRPTGTALLRHRAVAKVLGEGWRIINVSGEELVSESGIDLANFNEDPPENIVEDDGKGPSDFHEERTANGARDIFEEDISRFVRRDREGAHRPRAPPSEALPWVPSVMTLKQKPRRRRKNR